MDLLREAGPFGPLAVLFFLAGLVVTVTRGRAQGTVMSTAAPFVLAILAVGQLGQGLGQHAVREAIARLPEVAPGKLELLSAGTGEAASAMVISGGAALMLCAIAGVIALADRRS